MVEGETAREDRLGNVPNVVGFGIGEADRAESFNSDGQNFVRLRFGRKKG